MIQPAGDEEASSNALTELSLRVQEFDQEGNLAPAPSAGAFHFRGHSSSTRVRCRIVSRMRGRCLTVVTKISRALSRLLPAYRGIDTHAVPAPRFDLVEVAVVCIERVVGLFV